MLIRHINTSRLVLQVQTSPQGTWPTGFVAATQQMIAQKADTKFPFGSLTSLWSRQIPYTMARGMTC